MRDKLLAAASLLGAALASLCCIGPLLAAGLGLGAFGATGAFESWRPYELAATAALLAGAFYLTYRRQRLEQCDDQTCAVTNQKSKKILLWVVAAAVVALAAFPQYIAVFRGGAAPADVGDGFAGRLAASDMDGLRTVVYAVDGMTCESCALGLQATLSRHDGVQQVEVSYEQEMAHVAYDPTQVTDLQLSTAFEELGYTVAPTSGN